ncbi:MAG: TIGR02147 family protein [Bdellovibrionaceae bacterium]|nr:TIGR02147 family protein [Pseudobdellovibrionaceae bacterium]
MKSVFEYKNYRDYLIDQLGGLRRRTGQRSLLARAINCQTAYLSQILNGNADLSIEQAVDVNKHLAHSQSESRFFLLLLQKERAGTLEAKNFFQEQIDETIANRLLVKNRVITNQEISKEDSSQYYSNWQYIAIHMALSIPGLQTKESLATHFSLSLSRVTDILEFLEEIGVVKNQNGHFQMTPTHIHLGNDSENILKHHSNWRLQSLKSLDRNKKGDLHYSVVYSLSKKDAKKIYDEMLKVVENNLKIVGPSAEEVLYCYALDFFEV